MLAPALELRNINKSYDRNIALDGASISIAPGSIHGLIGENGAGKSSLMQVAYGLVSPDHGEILIDGAIVEFSDPEQAIEHGIGMLHQQANWLEQLSVFDNIMLVEPVTGFLYQDNNQARRKLELLRREFGFSFSLATKISQLNYSQRQLVDVLRSLYRGVRVLILDEPLALLSSDQADYLNKLLVLLKLQGISVIVVSHKLAVLHQLCDVISVIKTGQMIACIDPKQLSLIQLSKLMVGREINLPHPRQEKLDGAGTVLLQLDDITVKGFKRGRKSASMPRLSKVSAKFYGAEIVACVGLPNAGQELFIDVIAGMARFNLGSLKLFEQSISTTTRYNIKKARQLGIAYAPNPVWEIGLVEQFSMAESAYLGYQERSVGRWGLISRRHKNVHCAQLMQQWDIRPALPTMLSGSFSGGNQQKMVLAREFAQNPRLLLLNQPTHGVDAGAVEHIYRRLFELRDSGATIIFCSNDLDEVMSLADRVCIFGQGRLIKVADMSSLTKSQLSLDIINGGHDE